MNIKKIKLVKRAMDTKFTVGNYHCKENWKIGDERWSRVIVQGTQNVEPKKARRLGFVYKGIGRC